MSRRTTAIRFAAMAIESLTATDGGSLQAARDAVDRLSYEIEALRISEGQSPGRLPLPDEALIDLLTSGGAK